MQTSQYSAKVRTVPMGTVVSCAKFTGRTSNLLQGAQRLRRSKEPMPANGDSVGVWPGHSSRGHCQQAQRLVEQTEQTRVVAASRPSASVALAGNSAYFKEKRSVHQARC